MDFGRFVIAWLCSCRNVQVPLTPHIFDIMQSCQAAGAKLHAEDAMGINNLDDFIKKVDVLRHSARCVMKPPRLDPELLWRDPAPNWVTVFVHICEVGGLCRQWSSDRIDAVCQRASTTDAADICHLLKTISRSTKVRHTSITIELAKVMEAVEDNMEEPVSSTIENDDNEGGDNEGNDDDSTTNKKRCRHGVQCFKVPAKCVKCGPVVRRDVLKRHQQTDKCKAAARKKWKKKKQGKSMNKVLTKTTKKTKATARQSQRR